MSTNLPANISKLISDLEAAQQATPTTSSGDFQYLKMTKMGEWVFGAEETEVASNSAFVVDPETYAHGYVAWSKDGALIEEVMSPTGKPPVIMAGLPTLPAGVEWGAQVAFGFKCIEGAQDGLQLLYKTSSKGGREAVAELLAEMLARAKAGKPEVCPVVFLETTNYRHKQYGKIFNPVITIDGWIGIPSGDDEPTKEPKAALVETPVEPAADPTVRNRRTRKTG